jgi:hypothetical protein
MTIGIIKGNTIVGLEEESTEGTYVAPSATTSYIRPVEDGLEFTPSREIIERGLLNASPGKETPRMGEKSVAVSMSVECRGSGTEGADVDHGSLIKCALGATRTISTTTTSKNASHTSTVIGIEDADISKFNVGDIVLVKESGSHEVRPISAKSTGTGTATITFPFALDGGAPANSVVISKSKIWYTASSGHVSLSATAFWGNEIEERAIGLKVSQMALEGFEVGQVPKLNFSMQGLSYYHGNAAAAHTPAYDSGMPPIILGACVWRAGTKIQVPSFNFSLSNPLSKLRATCNADGTVSQRVGQGREITGTITPYKDDTTFGYYTDWNAGTEFSLFAYAYTPSSTTGEIEMGSVVAFWLPQCIATSFKVSDVDGILVDELGFKATRGTAGDQEELYMAVI